MYAVTSFEKLLVNGTKKTPVLVLSTFFLFLDPSVEFVLREISLASISLSEVD